LVMNRSRAIAIADRSATLSLKFMAALNLLFLVTFLVMIAFAAGKARADTAPGDAGHISAAFERVTRAASTDWP
jgi:uncharacterized protein